MEIRIHGRGGQGGVTGAKILALIYARLGKDVQTFGDYSGERSGAPVRAYTRVSDEPITNRNKVYHPDHLLVFDDSLLGPAVLSGVPKGGHILLNTTMSLSDLPPEYADFNVGLINATEIARKHGIGTKSLVIVNTTIAGAYCKLVGLEFSELDAAYNDIGFASNLDSAREAFETVEICETSTPHQHAPEDDLSAAQLPMVMELVAHVTSPATGLKTGTWSSQRPAYVEKLAPCSAFCPAGNDAIGFVQAMAANGGGAAEGAEILGRSTPLSAVCGRVCPAPCMQGCNRAEKEGTVNIRGLERWIAEQNPVAVRKVERVAEPKRLAIIGGGPAGLSAAYELAKAGHDAHIFDTEAKLGGVLRTGIPEYRLPRVALDREVDDVLALGGTAHCNEPIDAGRMSELASDFDGVIIAAGLQKLRSLGLPGEDSDAVEQGIRFLHRITMGGGATVSGHVVILGGGNTAMDCARSAYRAGAEKVTVAYRRTHAEMPAIREEIHEAEAEGVEMLMLRAPKGYVVADGKLTGIELEIQELGEPDESGRRSPKGTGQTETLDCDCVLLALGQSIDASIFPDGWEMSDDHHVKTANGAVVFGAGDISTWEGTVTHAIGSGRRAAGLALNALGVDYETFVRPERLTAVPATAIRMDHFSKRDMNADQMAHPSPLAGDYSEVNSGMADATEADRCFSCGKCTSCDNCLVYCPEGIIARQTEYGYAVDNDYCKGCGICVEECPRDSMEMYQL